MLRLQRKCECGGGPDCDCDSSAEKKRTRELHRSAAGPDAPQVAPANAYQALRSPVEMLSPETQSGFGNQGVLRMLQRQETGAPGRGVSIVGGPQADQQAGKAPTQTQPDPSPVQTGPTVAGQTGPQTPPAAQPYTAMFSMAQHGPRAHQACKLPDTPNCVVTWAKWRLVAPNGGPAPKVTVEEQFTKISGPDNVFNLLKAQANTFTTDNGGFFDDCYGLCVPDGTPPFTLQVEQNYKVNGLIASQTFLTYSSSGVMMRVCQRGPNGFGPPCRRY